MPTSDRQPTRVVLADDHVLFRDGLREILETDHDLEVVGEASDGTSAVAVTRMARPGLVILDVEMPGEGVTSTVTRILSIRPVPRIIVVSMYDDPQTVRDLVDLGVRGYLLKNVSRHELMSSVRAVLGDDERVVLSISRSSLSRLNAATTNPLSDREREVMVLVARAMSNAQIARRLDITESTVKRHLRHAFTKLDAVSRVDAINKAVAASLIPSQALKS